MSPKSTRPDGHSDLPRCLQAWLVEQTWLHNRKRRAEPSFGDVSAGVETEVMSPAESRLDERLGA